ncbi:MAG: amidohydrolase [Acidimicrobiaceae bacterium]|nr:amidohydrolase [Acidimicrobiaceae bacterium]
MTDLLIHGGAVVTVDDTGTIHDPGWVYVRGNRVAEVGAGEPPSSRLRQATEAIDAAGCAVMPGMTNAHTHLFQTLFRGLADDKALLDWLRDCIWPAAVYLDAETAGAAAMVGLVENLRGGATSVIDHQYIHTDEGINDAVCRAADELGVRFLLAHGWADRNYHPRMEQTAEQAVARADAARRRWDGHDDDRIRVELAPLIPWGCSDEAMRTTVAAARSWGRGTHIHCAETAVEVDMSLEERGTRHVTWLDSLGVLGPDMQLAHSVWLDDDELDLIAATGSVVVHCPVSNMYLASGVARVPEMRARGITVALASDGPGSNNRQDMFEVLKATVLLQKVHHLNPLLLQPADVLHLACRNGAAAFGLPGAFGMVAPGQRADLLVVDLGSPLVAPVHRVPSALVYNASPRDLRDVVVDGRILLRAGELVVADEHQIMAEANAAARRLFTRAGIASRVTRN